jgi:sulfur carrier protein
MNEVTLIINGDQRRVPALASVQELLEHLGLDARGVVVEVNENIIRRPYLRETTLNEGDRVELVHFVGGG